MASKCGSWEEGLSGKSFAESSEGAEDSKSSSSVHEPKALLCMNVKHPGDVEKYIEMDIV
jgi:hypothetical protein